MSSDPHEVPATEAAANSRPDWVSSELYPFADRWLSVDGSQVHYVDEGSGPPLLLMHGNPTWSFLYRNIILGLRDRYRCVAIDLPGFGLSTPAPGYRFLPVEHADVVERVLLDLDLQDVTMMTQDWGGPVGFGVATRNPERFRAFVVGNTWAWPEANIRMSSFSRLLASPLGKREILKRNLFVERVMPTGIKLAKLTDEEWGHYRKPFPTPERRVPTYVFPREILASRAGYLREVSERLSALADHPALLVWPTGDIAFRDGERRRWEALFTRHATVRLEGAGHYIQEDAHRQIVDAIVGHESLLAGEG